MLKGFVDRVETLVDRIGRNLTLRQVTKSGSNFNPTIATSDTTIRGAVFDFEAHEVDGSIIQRNDKDMVIAAKNTTVTKSDRIVDRGVEYTIISVQEIGPGDDEIFYAVQARA